MVVVWLLAANIRTRACLAKQILFTAPHNRAPAHSRFCYPPAWIGSGVCRPMSEIEETDDARAQVRVSVHDHSDG